MQPSPLNPTNMQKRPSQGKSGNQHQQGVATAITPNVLLPLPKLARAFEQTVFLRVVDFFVSPLAKNRIWKDIPVAMPPQTFHVDEYLIRSGKPQVIHNKFSHLSAGQLKSMIAKQGQHTIPPSHTVPHGNIQFFIPAIRCNQLHQPCPSSAVRIAHFS